MGLMVECLEIVKEKGDSVPQSSSLSRSCQWTTVGLPTQNWRPRPPSFTLNTKHKLSGSGLSSPVCSHYVFSYINKNRFKYKKITCLLLYWYFTPLLIYLWAEAFTNIKNVNKPQFSDTALIWFLLAITLYMAIQTWHYFFPSAGQLALCVQMRSVTVTSFICAQKALLRTSLLLYKTH